MKKIFLVIMILIFSTISTSCYDSTEVDDMIYILAIGIDYDEKDNIQYTFQSAVPLNISSGIETGFAASKESVTLQNIKVSAPNLYAAIDTANQKVTKEINISHCKLILFSRDFAEKSLETQLKSVMQNPELRPTVLVSVADGSADDYLSNISSPFELNPARYYNMVFDKDYSPQSFTAHLYDFEKSDVILVPLIASNNQITTSVIKNFVQIGTLNNGETVALNMLTGNFNNGYLTISPSMPAINLSQDNAPSIYVDTTGDLTVTINLSFYGTPTAVITNMQEFDREVKRYIENSCKNLLYKSTEVLNADIINIGKHVKKKFATQQDFKKYNWNEKYKNIKFKVNVEYRTIR